jgi:hypothetical protein
LRHGFGKSQGRQELGLLGFTVTRHALIAVLFCMAFSAFVVTVLADSLALKAARAKDDK